MERKSNLLTFFGFWAACAVGCILCTGVFLCCGWLDFFAPRPWAAGQIVRFVIVPLLPLAAILCARRAETLRRRQRGMEPNRTGIWDVLFTLYCAVVFGCAAFLWCARWTQGDGTSWFNMLCYLILTAMYLYRGIRQFKTIRQQKAEAITE